MTKRSELDHLTIERHVGSTEVKGSVFQADQGVDAAASDLIRSAHDGVLMVLQVKQSSPGAEGAAASLEAMALALADVIEQRESLSRLIDEMTPAVDVPSPGTVLQARRNSEARKALLEEFGALTGPQVADVAGSNASNRSALAARWRKEGRLLAVEYRDVVYYPGFQFGDDGRPLPVMADVLAIFRDVRMTGWEIALWFTSRNGWLDDDRPTALLESEPSSVVEAAEHEVAQIVG